MHTAYSPATRLLSLLDLLQSRPNLKAAELAAALQVNTRSARRYVTMLQDMGIPVAARRGRYGGYALRPGYKLPPLMFTDDEALAVTLGLLAARRLHLAEMAAPTAGALAKLERVLPLPARERVRAISAMVALDAPATSSAPAAPDHPPRPDLIALCSAASRDGRCVWLRYRQSDGAQTERMVDCYGVVYHDARWYVVGYCHLRQGMRIFRLDRVLAIAPREECFTRPPDFDCLAYAVQAFAAIPATWLIQALLFTTFADASQRTPPTFATLEQTPDGVLLRAYDASLEHAARFLVGLGCRFQVIAPPELLQTFSALAREIAVMVASSAPSAARSPRP
jgi:predicted DNA-binding transcriptional regulator YafY